MAQTNLRAAPRVPAPPSRFPLLLLALAALLLGSAWAPNAHETLRHSTPARDARLSTLPTELRLTFSSAVSGGLSRIVLLGPDSTEIALDSLRRHSDSASVLIAPIRGPLGVGLHTVVWQIAGADGHPVRGAFTFTILPEAVAAASSIAAADTLLGLAGVGADTGEHAGHGTQDDPELPTRFDTSSPLYAVVRWLNFVGILGVIGAVGLEMLVLRRPDGTAMAGDATDDASRRAVRLGLVVAGLTAMAALLRLGAQSWALQMNGDFDVAIVRAVLFDSLWGVGWLVQAASVLVALIGLVIAHRSHAGWSIAALGAIGLAISLSLSGHAADAPIWPRMAMVSDAVHVISAGGWLGTLLALVAAGLPAVLALPADERGPAAAAMVNAFSPAALVFAGLAVLTGVFATYVHLGLPPDFFGTAYGRVLLVKLVVFLAVIAAGAWNWRRVRPRLTEPGLAPHLRKTGTVELVLAGIVLAVTAVLVAAPPPGH